MINIKKVNFIFPIFKKKSWKIFTLVHFLLFFAPLLYGLGWTLWIQSLMIAISLTLIFLWLFSQCLKKLFRGSTLKGYDPWHLRPLLDKYTPKASLTIFNHKTPFCFYYDFYGRQHIVMSSSLTAHFKKDEIEALLQHCKIYFEKGFSKFFTQWSYWVTLIFFPFFLILILLKKINFHKSIETLFTYFLYIPFYPFIHTQFFQLDRFSADFIKNKNLYFNLLQKFQAHWEISSLKPHIFLSCLFFTNPLTQPASYFNIQPSVQQRLKKLTNLK